MANAGAAPTKADAVASLAAKGLTPRGLTRAEAAAYVGLSARTFSRRVAEAKLPAPHPVTGRWDVRALDAVLDPAASRPSAAADSATDLRRAIDAAIEEA